MTDIEQLEARLKELEEKNRKLEDTNEIIRLQRVYGYYVERGNLEEVGGLFSDNPDVSIEFSGKPQLPKEESEKSIFESRKAFEVLGGNKPGDYLHLTIPVSGVVDVDPAGKTAKGRWYALMYLNNATPGGGAMLGFGIYENDYIKEEGKWKILHLRFDDIFLSPYEDGWAKTPKLWMKLAKMAGATGQPGEAFPATGEPGKSPFGDSMPFHYKHPITGK